MTIIIDPQNAGISGNMIVGAFVDLGANETEIRNIMEYASKEFGKINVKFEKVNKSGIESTYCNVREKKEKNKIAYSDFIEKIDNLNIDLKILEISKNIFKRIAISESTVHGTPLNQVHFHEVGSADAVADVIGAVFGYFDLELDKENIIGLPVALGGGHANTQHGRIPVPTPATIEILEGTNCFGGPVNSELATPTGVAIYKELCDEFLEFIPMMKPLKTAYGAGTKDFDFPNVLRIIKTQEESKKQKINVIETNIDHLSGEDLGYLFDILLIEGASDVSLIPIIMKKNRPAYILKVISKERNTDHLVKIIFRETGTLGIRVEENTHRSIANREFIPLKIEINDKLYKINFKIALDGDELISYRAEYEDIKIIAIDQEMALSEVRNIANTIIKDYLENHGE